MNRKLFFWLEKLKITPHERITIVILLVVLLIVSLLNLTVEPSVAVDDDQYDAVLEEFERRTQLAAQEEAELMQRYYPEPMPAQQASRAVEDTTPGEPDSSDAVTMEPESEPVESPVKIKINTANHKQLEELPGVGPVYAGRIIAYRDSLGEIKSVEELLNIKGIGPKRLEDIKPLVEL